ncbi:MAG: YbhB/YbcL family Raf kinase inhibitor-like protein [Candidatus Moranbacteria bacterium]|nr:YbhB/YbcL family Raf kinase inhibitor-like protein [Candidatus Moranbacteria bacterium]
MKITSTAFENNGNIPPKYTCDETGMSPELAFSGVPQDSLSLTLIVHDPDASVSGGFTHWVIFNMSPSQKEIRENSKPESGIEGTNSGGKTGWVSPCPPSGAHHYHFTLYALDETLKLDSSATKVDIEKAIAGHILEQSELIGLYQRQ